MPEYEYRCKNCQQISSIERSMNASAEEAVGSCSHCGSADLARIWGASFVSSGVKGQGAQSAGSSSETCASNPSQPKSCCPCS